MSCLARAEATYASSAPCTSNSLSFSSLCSSNHVVYLASDQPEHHDHELMELLDINLDLLLEKAELQDTEISAVAEQWSEAQSSPDLVN